MIISSRHYTVESMKLTASSKAEMKKSDQSHLLVGSWLRRSIRNSVNRSQYNTDASSTSDSLLSLLPVTSIELELTVDSKIFEYIIENNEANNKAMVSDTHTRDDDKNISSLDKVNYEESAS